jgi:hypothetical protein
MGRIVAGLAIAQLWTGGALNYTLKDGRCVGEERARWVTGVAGVISRPRISPG